MIQNFMYGSLYLSLTSTDLSMKKFKLKYVSKTFVMGDDIQEFVLRALYIFSPSYCKM